MLLLLVTLGLSLITSPVAGGPNALSQTQIPRLGLPLVCTLGETCWVANYVDVDPTKAVRDFRCKARTYDTHDGTDFALRDLAVMAQGVPVVASAPGTVRNVRDGMEDVAITDQATRARISGRECGNGVVIDHEGGWQTQYCHLRRGSLRVKAADLVDRRSVLGMVGLSGKTEFPHVHLTVRGHGQVIDPFTGHPMKAGCGQTGQTLWLADQAVQYVDVALYNAGFSGGPPNIDSVRAGKSEKQAPASQSAALVLWVEIFGVEAGDRLRFRITDPDRHLILDHTKRVERTQARHFAFAGKKRSSSSWASGIYTGEVTLSRVQEGQREERTVTRQVHIP